LSARGDDRRTPGERSWRVTSRGIGHVFGTEALARHGASHEPQASRIDVAASDRDTVMGMNFEVGVYDTAALFWVVIAVMAAVAVITVWVARRRRWI